MKSQAFNPFLPDYEYIPDVEPHVFGNRVYLYGSHDRFNGKKYCQNDYVCWSAPVDDLSDWRYEGVTYRKTQDPRNKGGRRMLWAPDVQRGVDGRYYLYYFFEFSGITAVAVCDEPAGRYEFYGYVHYPNGLAVGEKKYDPIMFDPGVLVDDDGRVYLYTGFAPKHDPAIVRFLLSGRRMLALDGGYVTELEQDMTTVKEGPKLLFPKVGQAAGTGFEGHEFYEASSIRKVGEKYYFIYSSIHGHELCYATSDSPKGGYRYSGIIISNGDINLDGRSVREAVDYTANNHGSIAEINDQWFVFYHRQTNKHRFSRQACAEPIEIDQDGFIKQVERTSSGLNNRPLKGEGEYRARIACNLMSGEGAVRYGFVRFVDKKHPYFTQEGQDREENGNQYIANIRHGACAGFKYFDFENPKMISVKVRGRAQGTLVVSTTMGGDPVAEINLTPSKDFIDFSAPLTIDNGTHALFFTYRGKGSFDFISFHLY